MTSLDPDIFDDRFHGCALQAFVELAIACQGVPDIEATRLRAYQLYEEMLVEKEMTVLDDPKNR